MKLGAWILLRVVPALTIAVLMSLAWGQLLERFANLYIEPTGGTHSLYTLCSCILSAAVGWRVFPYVVNWIVDIKGKIYWYKGPK